MAQNMAKQKKNMGIAVPAPSHSSRLRRKWSATVSPTARAAPAERRVSRAMTRLGPRMNSRADSQLVRKSPSRRMGNEWSIWVARWSMR